MGAPADDDYQEIAQIIVEQQITVLIGMPGTLHRLFLNEQPTLRRYGAISKVFLGGEHLSEHTRELLHSCGVKLIRSAIYGSVDAGPLGHACQATADGVFHVMSDIQHLEIVDFAHDTPAGDGESGRLLVTSRARQGQSVQRYDIGDSGRWLPGPCECGLPSPRFELLGRHGKLLRIGTDFISLTTLAHHLQTPFQLILDHGPDGLERMRLRSPQAPQETHRQLQDYQKLTSLVQTGLLTVDVEQCAVEQFARNRHSGKTPLLIDQRR
jgi:phenylacetate-CoA ligase